MDQNKTGAGTENELKEEIRKLKAELRVANRDLARRDRTLFTMESNFSVKMKMLSKLAGENERHQLFLTHLMKNSVDFLILADSDLNIAYCSNSFLREMGIEKLEGIESKNVLDIYGGFVGGELFGELAGMLAVAVGQDETSRHDIVADIEKCGEPRTYRITNTPMKDKNFNGVIINWNDITDITNAKNSAEEASKSKSSFLATMSHEIRTPMNAIIGIAQIQMQKEGLPSDYGIALEKIQNSGNNLLGIINDILDMSKIETGKMELVPVNYDVPSLINDAVQLNIVRIGSKDIKLSLDIAENLPSRIIGDELRLKQILNNLLSNAIKYTEKGYVKLSVNHFPRDDGDIMLRFAVEDTGQGMKPEDREKLFSEYLRFNITANRATEGTGIGLSIVKSLTELMEGTIEVESEYGKGSVFTVTVKQEAVPCEPIGAELSERLRSFTFNKGQWTTKQLIIRESMPYGRVLVVDDVETNLFVAEGLMSPYGLQIETAISGFAAIEKVEKGNTYDVIFMDHMMPLMDGIETAQKLRANGYEGVIVALTANALVGNDEMFKQKGFDGFISKPIDIRHLNAALNKFIRDRHPEEAKKYKAINTGGGAPGVPPADPAINPKLFAVFCRDAEKAVVTLRETAANGDIKMFVTTAHAMKSALANVGEAQKSKLAGALEDAGLKGDMEFISANTEHFVETLEALIISLRPAEPLSGGNADVREDTAYLEEQLLKIKAACEDYEDAEAYAALDLLKEKQWKTETCAALEEIREALFLHSDFDAAAEQAGRMAASLRQ